MLHDTLGDLHAPCRFSVGIEPARLSELFDHFETEHRLQIEGPPDAPSSDSRERLNMVRSRQTGSRALRQRLRLTQGAERSWRALLRCAASLSAGLEHLKEDLSQQTTHRRRIAAAEAPVSPTELQRHDEDVRRTLSSLLVHDRSIGFQPRESARDLVERMNLQHKPEPGEESIVAGPAQSSFGSADPGRL